ncbi:Ion channel family protein [Trichinella spiralis]|uniref:Ion channel family protein n=1 Tax=Trichinella spiralis TaxID=6334 RepID=UPI0001EFCC2A|nr:Ion channel family protein [Trichinella spiralis]
MNSVEHNKLSKSCSFSKSEIWERLKVLYVRFGFRDALLCILLIVYGLLGATVFYFVDCPSDSSIINARDIALKRRATVAALLQTIQKNKSLSLKYVTMEFESILQRHDISLGVEKKHPRRECNYADALFYASTIFTTIGYGNLTCSTFWGRTVTIIYAIFGIPLMLTLVNSLGNRLFRLAKKWWSKLHRLIGKLGEKSQTALTLNWPPKRQMSSNADGGISVKLEHDPEDDSVPLPLALSMVGLYIILCAAILKMWETEWDYLTAFYFFFISLSTIGFGDVVPESTGITLLGFPIFIIGLALVSVCINVIQARVELSYKLTLDQLYVGLEKLFSDLGKGDAFEENGSRQLNIIVEESEINHSHTDENTSNSSVGVIQIIRSPKERKFTLTRVNTAEKLNIADIKRNSGIWSSIASVDRNESSPPTDNFNFRPKNRRPSIICLSASSVDEEHSIPAFKTKLANFTIEESPKYSEHKSEDFLSNNFATALMKNLMKRFALHYS